MGVRLAPLKALIFAVAALNSCEHTHAQTDNCARMCIKSIQYVCATNGKTYDNLCTLQEASCYSNNAFAFASNGPCATDPRPSTPINLGLVEPQPSLNIVQVQPLPTVAVESIAPPAPTFNCEEKALCNRNILYVCATNGKTFDNLCLLEYMSCLSGNSFSFASNGPCATDPRAMLKIPVRIAVPTTTQTVTNSQPQLIIDPLNLPVELQPTTTQTVTNSQPQLIIDPLILPVELQPTTTQTVTNSQPQLIIDPLVLPVELQPTTTQTVTNSQPRLIIDPLILPVELQPIVPPTLSPLTTATPTPVNLFPQALITDRLGFLRALSGGIITKAFPTISASSSVQAPHPTLGVPPSVGGPLVIAPAPVVPPLKPLTSFAVDAPLVNTRTPVATLLKPATIAPPILITTGAKPPLPTKITPIPKPTSPLNITPIPKPTSPHNITPIPKPTPAVPAKVTPAKVSVTSAKPASATPTFTFAKPAIQPSAPVFTARPATTTPTYVLCEATTDCVSSLGGKNTDWLCVRPMRCRPVKCVMTQVWNPIACGPKECPPSAGGMSPKKGYCRPA